METVQETIDKVRNQLNNNIINNLDAISWGNSPEETLAAIQSAPVQEAIMSQAQGSSLVGDTLGAFGIGAGSMLNNTITGGAGLALGNLGRITEAISPFSGWDNDTLTHLANLGMTSAEAYEKSPYRDSWLTSMGKGTLAVHNAIDDALGDLRTQVLGSDPSLLAKGMEGFGSNIGFIIAMALASANPLTAALAGATLESVSEAGGLLGDAYRKGLYDKGAIGAANKSFLANMALNTALDYTVGPFGKVAQGVKNPFLRFLTGGIAEQFNELPQETLQQVIEQAAMNSLENGTDFLPELGQGIKQAPEIFMQIAPEVALSTLFGTLARGAGGLATRRGRHNIAKQSVLSRHDTVTNPNGELQLRTHQPDMDFLRQSFADDLTAQKTSLQDIINGIYQSGNEEIDTNPDLIGDVQRHSSKISTIDEQLEAIKNFGRQAEIQQTVDEIQSTLGEQGTEQSNEDLQGTTPEQNIPDNEPVQEVKKPKRGRKKKNTAAQAENTQDLSNNAVEEDEDNLPEFTPTEDTVKNYKAKNVAGSNTARITTAARTEVDVRYRIVDADDLIASTTETGAPNPNYLQELQPRQRDKITSLEQIDRIANHLDPEQLGANRMASDGAPVIGSDMMVESGNGRVLGIRKAYKYGKAEHYRDYLRQNAEMFGLTPEEVDKVKNPVLVRERLTDVDRVKFTSEANESSLATMSASENALDDAKKITMSMFNNYDNDKEFEDNEDFIKAVISALPDNERGNLLQADGKISRAGLERVRNAMAAKAYNSDSILRRLSELLDDDVRNISRALVHASPAIAKLESEIENGTKRKDLSLRDDILKAVNQFVNIKKQKKKISDWLAQPALFEEENESPVVRMLMEFFDKNIRAYKRISDGLLRYVELASQQANSGEQVLFEDSIRSKEDMLEEALLHATGEYDEITNTAEKRKKNKTSSENNNVSPTRDDIYNSNFKRFFGDWEKKPQKASKVVDKNGLPLIVYHGTDAKSENGEPPFTEFDTKGTNKGLHGDTTDTGAWFHSSKKAANSYGGYVYQVYLNIRNPYIYDCTGKNPKTIAKKKDQIARDVRAGKYGKGYDGVIFRNIEDVLLYFGFEAGENTKGDVYVVFDKRQVKSATQNNGMYGQATGNIFKQSANPVLAQEEQLRQEFKQKIIDAHRTEDEAEQLSHIYIAANRYFSKYFGVPIDKIIQADNLSIDVVPSDGNNRGKTLFYREKRDIFGNIIQEARTIMQLTNEADRSTVLHELGHIFLNKFRRLAASGMLKGRANQDWQTLVKALKLQGIDFSQDLSGENKRKLDNAHEQFAVSFEKYLMTGKAPTPKLKHVFEAFKRWLTDIYHSIRDIVYEGSDGQLHTFELSPKVREVFDSMLSVDSSADGSVSNDESLISPEDVEQYNQRTYYASGQPLEGDKFDFQKMRQAETFISLLNTGPAWGVTTTQTRFQAKEYRKLNRDFDKQKRIHFRNRGGKDAHEAVRNFKNKEYREAAEWVLLDLERRVDRDTTPEEFDAIKANLLETYQRVHAEEKIHFINQIVRMTVDEDSAGNLYIVDTPDDSLLLDGNLPLAKQPEHVKRAVRGIHEQLKLWGVSLWSGEKIKQSPRQKNLFGDDIEVWNASQMTDVTGIEFYGKLSTAMEKAIGRWQTKITSPKYGEIRNGRMAASIILNRFGVPGLRVKRKGFYTYTTWNEDMLRVLGMSKDSDNDTVRELDRQEEAKKKQQRREQIERSQPSKIAQFLGRERLLQEGEVNINLYGGERGAEPSKHRVTVDTADESYQQIGAKRKKEMDAALTKNRPDMSPEQRAEAISEIEKLGESVRQGGNPKVEKIATHWLLKGHIILPEDNYKILDAIKICKQQHIDPMSVDDPNTILAKYTIKETAASRRINPDTIPEFSNKKTYNNGITIYTVDDTREGQQAVRRIIDTHWGEDANPWCLAARQNGNLDDAWEYWSETYNAIDKRIAFKDGKLLAFCASDGEVTWWDREDAPHSGLPYTVKDKGTVTDYSINEKTGKAWRERETLSDGTVHEWYENEQMRSEKLPDWTERKWHKNGVMSFEWLPDGTKHQWYENKQMSSEVLPDGTTREWYENGQIGRKMLPDETVYNWHENGQMAFAAMPDGRYYKWSKNGHLKSINLPMPAKEYYIPSKTYELYSDGSDGDGHLQRADLPDGHFHETVYNWDIDGQAKYVILPDGTAYAWDNNGELISADFPDRTHYYPNSEILTTAHLSKSDLEKLNQDQQRIKHEAEQRRLELEQEIADEVQRAEIIAQYDGESEPESYYQAAYSPRGFMRKIIDKVASSAKKILAPTVKSAPNASPESIKFANEETERRYRDSMKGVQQLGLLGRIKRSTMGLVQSMKGDFPELSGDAMKFAKEQFRMLQRKKSSQVKQAMQSFTENLRGLDSYQRDLFGRKRLLDDLMWRKKNYPDAELPFGFTEEMLKKEAERFDKLVKSESAVTQAIQREEQTMQSISNEFIALAKDLGLNLEGVLRNPHYYRHTILEYANAAALGMPRSVQKSNASLQDFVDSQLRGITGRGYLKRYKGSTLDISTNYVQANGEVRAQMLMDIEVMKALREIKKKYDIAPKLRKKLQRALREQTDIETHSQPSTDDQTISDIIPDGYTLYDPAGSRLIQSANSSTENIISMAVDDAARQSGLPLDRLLRSLGSLGEDAINRLLVIPNEIANALDNMSKDRERGMLGNAARVLTNWWKKAVLFSPTRNIKYNFRNFTGDLDALIAGNPKALKFFPQAVRELTAHYRGKNTSQDLQDYIERSGGLNIDSMQITPNEADALQELAETQPASLGKRGWNLVKKFFRNEVAFTAWRENLLRYAAYLSYKQDMEQNNGTPSSWGASIKDEVMSVDDVRDRAYKMSNELLGAYDQISEFGRQLRDLAIPFWSWSEINLKRYYRLLKNGLTGQNSSDFAKRFMLAKSARVPFYAISAAETFAKISLFTMLAQMFNRIVMPDDDDELPPDIKNKPHITLGKVKGQVYYFDRIGALGDAAEWLGLDNIVMDTQQMRRGSMPFAEFMKKVITAPAGKVLQEVNPLFRMPYELATGRTIYPDVSHPRMIRDNGAYISQTFGLSWPYKAATGKPRSDWDEFKNMFVYSADAEEAAYFYSLDMVRQFQERVLGKRFDGFAQTKRGQVLQKLKAALRFNDKNAIKQSLREYAALDGTPQGLKASMKSMNPLYGLDKEEQKKFMRWISQEDRKYLRKANTYYHRLADKYIR